MNMNIKYLPLIFFIFLGSCDGSKSSQSQKMVGQNLNCPDGSHAEFGRWGGVGEGAWVHNCKMKHGKFSVWKGEFLIIEEYYEFGKKTGEWFYYDESGKVTKTISYKGGEEIK